jgi:hypothetical protein
MIVFGKWPLWIVIGVLTFGIAAALAAAGNIVLMGGSCHRGRPWWLLLPALDHEGRQKK